MHVTSTHMMKVFVKRTMTLLPSGGIVIPIIALSTVVYCETVPTLSILGFWYSSAKAY